jgi:hypothetical protein
MVFPRWLMVLCILLLLVAFVPGGTEWLIGAWLTLYVLFSLLPVIGLVLYLRRCRRSGVRPSFRGYWEFLHVVRMLRRTVYQGTARALVPGDAPRIAIAVVAWSLVVLTFVGLNWRLLERLFGGA